MWDGYLVLLPIQGAVVAVVFLIIAVVKNARGIKGSEAFTWNTIGIVCFLYLFTTAAWIATGSSTA